MVRRFQEHSGPLEVLGVITDRIWGKSYGQPNVHEARILLADGGKM